MDLNEREIGPETKAKLLENVIQPDYQPRLKLRFEEDRINWGKVLGHAIVPLYDSVRYLKNPENFGTKALLAYDWVKITTAVKVIHYLSEL